MDQNMTLALILSAAAAALILFLALRLRKSGAKPPPAQEEVPPALVEGMGVFTGVHKGVKYWVYLEGGQARLEIETGGEVSAPFMADRREGKPAMPGDARDAEVLELFKLRARYVEAACTGDLFAALFPENVLNENAGSAAGPSPAAPAIARAVELLAAIREKSRPSSPVN